MVEQTPGLWLVEACAGSGKSHFARELGRRHDCGVAPKLPITHDRGDPDPVVVDVEDHLWDPASDEVAHLLSRPDDALTVVVARRIGPAGRDVAATVGARWLRAADMWFDDDELAELGELTLDDAAARRFAAGLRSITDAWPAAVTACLEEAQRSPGESDFGGPARTAFASVLAPAVAALDPELQRCLEAVSFFERFDAEMAELLGCPHVIERLLHAGLPLIDDGRWVSLRAFAQATVRSGVCGVPDVSEDLFGHLVDKGRRMEAVEAATELGHDDTAARLLAQTGVDEASRLDVARSGAICARLGAAIEAYPRMHLVRARQHQSHGDLSATIQELRRGVEATTALAPEVPVVQELRAELAFAEYYSGDLDAARGQLPVGDFADPAARARQYQVVAGLDALTMRSDALDRAATSYRTAEQLWRTCGETVAAGTAVTGLAMEVTSRIGRLNEAVALIERALPTTAANPVRLASAQLLRLRLLALAGRHDDARAQLREVEGLYGIVLRGWVAAHAHQAQAIMASHVGDRAEALRHITLAQTALGDLTNHSPGAWLHIDAVDVFARCGDAERTAEHLSQLREHPATEEPDLRFAEIVAACRVGDPEHGRTIAEAFRKGDIVVPGGDWKLNFMESVAASRLSQTDDATQLFERAQRGASDVGTPDIIEATEGASAPSTPFAQTWRARIELLSDFAVHVEGESVDVPRGHGRTLLKLLSLRSGQLTIDEMIETAWPDGDLALGRRRLRNVLSRLRTACGDLVERDGDVLRLAPDVTTDFAEWWEASVAALADHEVGLLELRELVAAAPDVLLAPDRYEEWLQPLQRRYHVQLLSLLDKLVLTARDDNIDVALDAQRRALGIDPWSTDRLDRAIELSRSAGKSSEADALERQRDDLA